MGDHCCTQILLEIAKLQRTKGAAVSLPSSRWLDVTKHHLRMLADWSFPPPPPPPSPPLPRAPPGLSVGAIVAIVSAVVAAVMLASLFIFWRCARSRQQHGGQLVELKMASSVQLLRPPSELLPPLVRRSLPDDLSPATLAAAAYRPAVSTPPAPPTVPPVASVQVRRP